MSYLKAILEHTCQPCGFAGTFKYLLWRIYLQDILIFLLSFGIYFLLPVVVYMTQGTGEFNSSSSREKR